MINDLLFGAAALNDSVDEDLNTDDAVEAVIETIDRDVSDDEREEFRETLESGWLGE